MYSLPEKDLILNTSGRIYTAFINLLEGPYIYGEHISKGSKVSYRDLGGLKVWAGGKLREKL